MGPACNVVAVVKVVSTVPWVVSVVIRVVAVVRVVILKFHQVINAIKEIALLSALW